MWVREDDEYKFKCQFKDVIVWSGDRGRGGSDGACAVARVAERRGEGPGVFGAR